METPKLKNIDNFKELLLIPLVEIKNLPIEQIIQLSTIQTNDDEEKMLRKLSNTKPEKLSFTDKVNLDKLTKLSAKCKEYRYASTVILAEKDEVQNISKIVCKSYKVDIVLDHVKHFIIVRPNNFEDKLILEAQKSAATKNGAKTAAKIELEQKKVAIKVADTKPKNLNAATEKPKSKIKITKKDSTIKKRSKQ